MLLSCSFHIFLFELRTETKTCLRSSPLFPSDKASSTVLWWPLAIKKHSLDISRLRFTTKRHVQVAKIPDSHRFHVHDLLPSSTSFLPNFSPASIVLRGVFVQSHEVKSFRICWWPMRFLSFACEAASLHGLKQLQPCEQWSESKPSATFYFTAWLLRVFIQAYAVK